MKANEIKVGEKYTAKVSGRITTVRVDAVRERFDYKDRCRTVYDVTNLATGRRTTFRSAMKFRGLAPACTVPPAAEEQVFDDATPEELKAWNAVEKP